MTKMLFVNLPVRALDRSREFYVALGGMLNTHFSNDSSNCIMLAGDGLKPTSQAKRVHFDGTSRRVIDGPFTETREIVAGYWLWEVKDMDEAVAWVKRCPNPMLGPSDIDIRPIFEAADFAEMLTPEILELHERNTDKLTQRNGSGE